MVEKIILSPGSRITINTVTRRLRHYNGDRLINEYPVAVGKPSTPTPSGEYKVKNKIINPGGVLGNRWMGMTIPDGNYGIHGTNNPSSIGQAVSLGCVRMHNNHVEELFPQISIGTPVHIFQRSEAKVNPGITAPVVGGKTYTVQAGDTLYKIAKAHNVSLDKLIAANNISDPSRIYLGQVIIIP